MRSHNHNVGRVGNPSYNWKTAQPCCAMRSHNHNVGRVGIPSCNWKPHSPVVPCRTNLTETPDSVILVCHAEVRNGIRDGLKHRWALALVGSNPTFGILPTRPGALVLSSHYSVWHSPCAGIIAALLRSGQSLHPKHMGTFSNATDSQTRTGRQQRSLGHPAGALILCVILVLAVLTAGCGRTARPNTSSPAAREASLREIAQNLLGRPGASAGGAWTN